MTDGQEESLQEATIGALRDIVKMWDERTVVYMEKLCVSTATEDETLQVINLKPVTSLILSVHDSVTEDKLESIVISVFNTTDLP